MENGEHGSSTAAPVARKVMDAYLLPRLPPPATSPGAGFAPAADAAPPVPVRAQDAAPATGATGERAAEPAAVPAGEG